MSPRFPAPHIFASILASMTPAARADGDRICGPYRGLSRAIEEGERYKFGKVEIDADLQGLPLDALLNGVPFGANDRYDASLVDNSVDAMVRTARLGGRAFIDVRPRVRLNKSERTADVFKIAEGPRLYIERINIVGNTRTLDKEIRDEICLVEGGPLNRVLVDRSRSRVRDLGFFKNVEITDEPGSRPDRVVINLEVEEDLTGEFYVSAGASSAELTLGEKNLFGTGHSVRLRVGVGVPGPAAAPWTPRPARQPC